jgi:hypothetical protein
MMAVEEPKVEEKDIIIDVLHFLQLYQKNQKNQKDQIV